MTMNPAAPFGFSFRAIWAALKAMPMSASMP